jgi:hypothetical protein
MKSTTHDHDCIFIVKMWRKKKIITKVVRTGPDVEPVEVPVHGLKVRPGLDRGSTGIN